MNTACAAVAGISQVGAASAANVDTTGVSASKRGSSVGEPNSADTGTWRVCTLPWTGNSLAKADSRKAQEKYASMLRILLRDNTWDNPSSRQGKPLSTSMTTIAGTTHFHYLIEVFQISSAEPHIGKNNKTLCFRPTKQTRLPWRCK